MAHFPVECLPIFTGATSVSRDFSLHYFYHRLIDQGQKPLKKKHGCIFTLWYMYMAYNKDIIDPRNDGNLGPSHPSKTQTMSDWFAQRFLKKRKDIRGWDGLLGTDRVPSPEDWQNILLNSTLFFYWGHGRIMSHLDPSFLAVLNLTGKSIRCSL
jgi:hypothetical protein